MTFAEILFLVAGVTGIYYLLRPLQRWLELLLLRRLVRHPRLRPPIIDVADFESHGSRRKDDHHS